MKNNKVSAQLRKQTILNDKSTPIEIKLKSINKTNFNQYQAPKSPKGDLIRVKNASKLDLYKKLNPLAQEMRKNPTFCESLLWNKLKNNQLGVKFRRQHIIDRFIVDFYSIKAQLAIEVDGDIHIYQKDRDQDKNEILQNLGLKILRFTNTQIQLDIEDVLSKIKAHLIKSPLGDLGA